MLKVPEKLSCATVWVKTISHYIAHISEGFFFLDIMVKKNKIHHPGQDMTTTVFPISDIASPTHCWPRLAQSVSLAMPVRWCLFNNSQKLIPSAADGGQSMWEKPADSKVSEGRGEGTPGAGAGTPLQPLEDHGCQE